MNYPVIEEERQVYSEEYIRRAIEAVLFATGESVSYDRIAAQFDMTPSQIKHIAKSMVPEFEKRGIELLCYDKTCQLCTKKEYETIIKNVLGIHKNGALSNSCLETLAIIAYNQPVTRAYIDEVRGVDSSYAIGVLMQRDLIKISGRLDVPGKPNLYATNDNFLMVFGLSSLSELPKVDILNESPDNPVQQELPLDEPDAQSAEETSADKQ